MNLEVLDETGSVSGSGRCVSMWGRARATLIDRGSGLIYDDVLDVTWLQDANYAGKSMNWCESVSWSDWGLSNTGPFVNLNPEFYRSGTEYATDPDVERRLNLIPIDFPDRRSGDDRRSGRDRRKPKGFRSMIGMDRRRRVFAYQDAPPDQEM